MTRETRYHKGSTDGKRRIAFDPLARLKPEYDVVVVGSGLGGMTAANVLGRAGHRVCLLEQHYNFGGLATWFKRRGGHVFDVSLHGFPAGMQKTCRKYWSPAIAARIVRLDGIRFDNPQFAFETAFTREDFTDKLVTVLRVPRPAVDRFFEHVRGLDFFDDDGTTVAELFERFFPGRNDVHRLLLEPITYANGSTLDDPAIAYAIVFANFMSRGVYTFSGGTDALIRAMRAELAANGVELFNHAQVERIVVDGARARGVVVNGREVAAQAVISNANVKTTIERLVGREHLRAAYLAEADAVRLNNSSCQVFLGIREGESIPFLGDLFFTSTRPTFDSPSLCELETESRTFSLYYPKTRPGSNRYAIVSSTNAWWHDWAHLSQPEYEAQKARLVTRTLDALERYLPDVRRKVDHVEAATPRTFAFYTQHPAGTSFGTKFEGLKVSLALPGEIEGLYHAGSVGIIMSGWLGAANYGAIVANKVDALLHARRAGAGASA